MKNLILYVKNGLFAEAIKDSFKKLGEYRIDKITDFSPDKVKEECKTCHADILLMDVSFISGNTFREKLVVVLSVKSELPRMKIAVLCDTTIDFRITEEVKNAKRMGKIDAFFFESVDSDYLVASIDSL